MTNSEANHGINSGATSGASPGVNPEGTPGVSARRRGPDLITLAAGLGSLALAATALFGGDAWTPGMDVRWVLAAAAILVGLLMVIGSIHPRRG